MLPSFFKKSDGVSMFSTPPIEAMALPLIKGGQVPGKMLVCTLPSLSAHRVGHLMAFVACATPPMPLKDVVEGGELLEGIFPLSCCRF